MTGTYLPEYEGELRAALDREESDRSGKNEQEGGRYILAVHQGDTVCTLFFKKITLEDVYKRQVTPCRQELQQC